MEKKKITIKDLEKMEEGERDRYDTRAILEAAKKPRKRSSRPKKK